MLTPKENLFLESISKYSEKGIYFHSMKIDTAYAHAHKMAIDLSNRGYIIFKRNDKRTKACVLTVLGEALVGALKSYRKIEAKENKQNKQNKQKKKVQKSATIKS